MSSLKPIILLPARERVASAIRQAILRRELKENQEITLEEMAGKLGVSITPVREAFQVLDGEGLIHLRPNKGAIVLGINENTIRDHFEIRAVLEAEAAMKVCNNHADLTDIISAFESSKIALKEHNGDYSNCNQAFHYGIWDASGNVKIKLILSGLWNGLSMGYNTTESAYAKISFDEHENILNAIKNRNAKLAGDLMKKHINRSYENIMTNYK